MADNIVLNSGSGGSTLKTDEDTGASAHDQVVKIELGVNGSFDGYLSSTNPMPAEGPAAENAAVSGNPLLTGGRYDATPRTLGDGDVGAIALDADGAVQVSDGGNTLTVDGTVTANLSATDNTVLDNIDTNTDYGQVVGGGAEATALRVTIANDSTGVVSVDDGGGALTVDGTVTANLSATDNAVLDQIEVNTSYGDNTGGGTETGALRVTIANDSTGVLSIDDNGGSITVDGSVTADLGANNDVTVTGGNAHDGTTLGNPVLGGARATNSIEGVTQVANADLTYVQADLNGVLISRPHTTLEEIITERVADTAGTSANFTNFAAGGAGVHNYVTTISIYNSSATDGYVDFRDGSAGSVIFTAAAPAAGGSVITFPVPLKGAANTALAYDVSGALSTVYISVIGFQAQG